MTDPALKVANDVIGKFAAEMAELTTRIALVEMALADFDGRTTLGVRAVVKAVRDALDWKPESDTSQPGELNVSTSDGEQEVIRSVACKCGVAGIVRRIDGKWQPRVCSVCGDGEQE